MASTRINPGQKPGLRIMAGRESVAASAMAHPDFRKMPPCSAGG
ncbi:hypothetical protein DSC_00275 [Pseudoxanthomonas spadix BD-a59]|uniref:Uncharacterized protein n=1 Tax=Pseudoxanthomonas spadix (strain BD-a59) TaxID=1045855 RepID=G7US39_PSEUP|nr:hypothetical protein DSC_00275 [Pseudoxanthomonas spadix BD-a59]